MNILDYINNPFQKAVAKVIIINELGGSSVDKLKYSPFTLTNALSGKSGISYGYQQIDLKGSKDGSWKIELIKDIHEHEFGKNSFSNSLKNKLVSASKLSDLSDKEIQDIEQALNSSYGQNKLNQNFIDTIPNYEKHINEAEEKLRTKIPNFKFTEGQKVMLIDYHNQYNLTNTLEDQTCLLTKIKNNIQKKGYLSNENLYELLKDNKYYRENEDKQKPRIDRNIKEANIVDKQNGLDAIKSKNDEKIGTTFVPDKTKLEKDFKAKITTIKDTNGNEFVITDNNDLSELQGSVDFIVTDNNGNEFIITDNEDLSNLLGSVDFIITDTNGIEYSFSDGVVSGVNSDKQIGRFEFAVDALNTIDDDKNLNKITLDPNSTDEVMNGLSDEEKNKIDTAAYAKTKTDNLDTIKMVTYYSGFLPPLSYEETKQKLDKLITTFANLFKDGISIKDLKDSINNNSWIKSIRDFRAEHKIYDPFVLDLNHDGIINTSALSDSSSAFYDLDKDGFKEQTGWLDSSDGFLVDKDNKVFGINSLSGFNQLKLYDTNYDNKLDITDTEYTSLKVWRDDNQDGTVDEFEVNTLEELNITEINLLNTAAHETINGNTILAKSTFKQDNIDYLSADVNFQINDTITQYTTDYDLSSEEISLKGFGKIKDLNIITYENQQFKDWINTNLNTTENIISNFDLFLKKWANIISPTKDSTALSFSEKTWIVETFADKNGLKTFIEGNDFSDYLLNLRTSISDKNEISLEYENLKLNYMSQYLFQTILKDNSMGLSVSPDTNTIYIKNIYKFYSDLSNIINTKSNNEIILYLHMLKDNNILNAVDLSLISPLINDIYLLKLFKESNFDHIISDLNKQITNNEIIVPINNIYANQFVYLENNKTTIKGQQQTTFLTKENNTITTEGFNNLFLLKDGINTINSSKGTLVDIKSENSLNTLTLTSNNLVNVDLKNSASTLVLNNNTMANITSDKGITLNNTNTYGTANSIKINASNEDDNIYTKTTINADIVETGGNNKYTVSFSKNLNFSGTGNNTLITSSALTTDIDLKDGNNILNIEKAVDLNINLENSVSSITLANNTNETIYSDKALIISSSNVNTVNKSILNSSAENDDIYFKKIKDLSITDIGGTNKIKSSFVDLANIKTSNGVNNTLTLERILDLNLNIENSSNSILSFYGNTNTKVKSDSGLSLSVTSYQYENMIDLNLSEQKDLITIDREKQININDLGGDNNIKITNSINSNIKTGNGNDIITYKSTGINVIEAGAGNDTITSNAGEDTFVFNKGNGNDVITNIGGVKDIVSLYNFVKDKVIFYFKGSDLVIGTEEGNSVTIKTQTTLNNQIEEVQLRNDAGSFKLDVNKLVQDMNAFTKTTGFSSTNEIDIRKNQALMNVFSSSWVGN